MAGPIKNGVEEPSEGTAPIPLDFEFKRTGPETLTADQLGSLIADLNPLRVASRSQGGSKLSYLEAWDVRAALIRNFGFGGFSVETLHSEVYMLETDVKKSSGTGTTAFRATTIAHVQLKIAQFGAVYSEVAASSQSGSVPGDVIDFALKTAVSDAMKRCAINLGTQFGLSLYRKGSTKDVIVKVVQPDQAKLLPASKADLTPKDVADDIATGTVDPDRPAGIEGDDPTTTPDFLAEANAAITPDEVRDIWRRAKQAGAPQSLLKDITKVGVDLQQAGDESARANAEAAAALASGFKSGDE